jgi:tetratricopeptide (TPR) repeat protein
MSPELSEQRLKCYVEWGQALSRVKNILLQCRKEDEKDKAGILIEATHHIQQAIDLSCEFPRNDLRRFLTLSTAIALYCHLHQYSYVELDRQIILRMSKRYPRPAVGELLNSLGMLYQEHGKLKEATQLYKRAIKLLPSSHPRFDLLVSNLESITDSSLRSR